MRIFKPWMYIKNLEEITAKIINDENIKLVMIDFDNTLAKHKTKELIPHASRFLEELKKEEIEVYILSNARKKRIDPVLLELSLNGRGMSYKPLPFIINKIVKRFGIKKSEVMLIGDQIFTDIIAGNLSSVKTVFVDRISDDEGSIIRIKRRFEKCIIREGKYK